MSSPVPPWRRVCGSPPHLSRVLPVAVGVVCGSLPDLYVEKLLGFLASCLETSSHLQFYLSWTQKLLMLHTQKLKNR